MPTSCSHNRQLVRLRIADLNRNIQARIQLNPVRIADYVARRKAGSIPPRLLVVKVNGEPWLADGNHRAEAAAQLGVTEADCIVIDGTEKFCLQQMAKANRAHGEPLTDNDRHHLAIKLLECDATQPDEVIGNLVGASAGTVASWRPEVKGAVDAVRKRNNGVPYTCPGPKPPPTAKECAEKIPEVRRQVLAALQSDLTLLAAEPTGAVVSALAQEYRGLERWLSRHAAAVAEANSAPADPVPATMPTPLAPLDTIPQTNRQIAEAIISGRLDHYLAPSQRAAENVRIAAFRLGHLLKVAPMAGGVRVTYSGKRSTHPQAA